LGRNNRAKKPKGRTVTMNEKQIESMKRKLADDITKKVMLLVTCAMVDELSAIPDLTLPDAFMENFTKRTERYATNLDAHLFKMRDLGESIYKQTGVDWRGW